MNRIINQIKNQQQTLSNIIYEKILSRIIDGTYDLNSKLPTEVSLCSEFNVSRPVLRDALSRLREDKLIVSRRGSGSYVIKQPDDTVLQFSSISCISDVQRCFEFRANIEANAAALAAERRTLSQLSDIINAYEQMNIANSSNKLATEEDFHFHITIAEASNNHFYTAILHMLRKNIKEGINITRNLSLLHSESRLNLVQEEHYAIISAIKDKDPIKASTAMKEHLDNAKNRMFDGAPK